jgi:hypothetical protein
VPDAPTGRTNLTDPDSRPVKTARGFIQGYSAQAVATPEQIIAADVTIGGNDRALLGPMITAAASELEQAGITEPPGIVLADAGDWNGPHIDALVARGMQVLVRPDADTRKAPSHLIHARRPRPPRRPSALPPAPSNHRARLRPHQDLPPRRPPPAPRPHGLPRRMAAAGRHPQPPGMKLRGEGSGGGVRARG